MRRMERALLLQIVDSAWKEHLLTMDRLRSSVGLSGYAQKDPKVEYKREGMKLYDNMWFSIGEQVTDLIFRMEQLNEQFVGSTWVETSATHEDGISSSDAVRNQGGGDPSQPSSSKPKTVRNAAPKVGGEYGKGKVFCFSAHPELTDGLHHLIPTVVKWLAEAKTK